MSRADIFEFTLDEESEKRLYELLTDIDVRNTNRFWIKDKRGYHAEYVKIRHGKWEYGENESGYDGYSCSKCDGHVKWNYAHENIDFIPQYYRYCPYCGARMDEDEID